MLLVLWSDFIMSLDAIYLFKKNNHLKNSIYVGKSNKVTNKSMKITLASTGTIKS